MSTQTPMAFLLVKFQGTTDEPMTRAEADQMFMSIGRGTMNVVDWFEDNSHGQIDMTGNQVFGWLELTETLSGYGTKRADGTYGRSKIIDLGRDAASAAGIDLSKFTAVVVVTNFEVDLFGGSGQVCCTAATAGKQFWEIQAAPSVLCQEMIHGLGVSNHTRHHGSDADYQDPFDVMSMFNADPGHSPSNANRPVGPGLNAAFMQRCGWLDLTRSAPLGQIVLRPLHRRDRPGPLYAIVGDYYVEYRAKQRWDTGFSSVVLVHYLANDTSYLIAELRVGSPAFSWGNPHWPYEPQGSIRVDAIDDTAETATLTTAYRPARPVPVVGPAWSLFETEFADGGGIVILGGRIIRIPPRSPAFRLVEAAAELASVNDVQLTPALKTAVRAEVFARTLALVGEQHEELTGVSSPLDHITREEAERFHNRKEAR